MAECESALWVKKKMFLYGVNGVSPVPHQIFAVFLRIVPVCGLVEAAVC